MKLCTQQVSTADTLDMMHLDDRPNQIFVALLLADCGLGHLGTRALERLQQNQMITLCAV